ncbi:MAG TPA: tRNA pseudouridine(55) synthase TruB [Gemmatimonadales bacterium]
MTDGFLPVDKPAGPTSHDVVAIARRAFRTRRVGHAGTLDPFATGLLLVLVGRATRLAPYLSGLPKAYTGRIRLGTRTDTDDRTGQVLSQQTVGEGLSDADILAEMAALTGRYAQEPPQYSAKKVEGRRAYALARRGQTVSLRPALVEVARFTMTRRAGADLEFLAEVSSGTYLRSLARDLGERLGCGGHLDALRRVSVGGYAIAEAESLEAVREGRAVLRPMLEAVRDMPRMDIDEAARARVRHGQALSDALAVEGPVALVGAEGLVAVAEPQGGQLEPRVVLEG